MADDLRQQIATIEAERAALPEDERLRAEAADAPLLRVQLAHLAEELEAARAAAQAELRGGLDCARLAVQWQERAEQAEATVSRVRAWANKHVVHADEKAGMGLYIAFTVLRLLDGPAVSEKQTGDGS